VLERNELAEQVGCLAGRIGETKLRVSAVRDRYAVAGLELRAQVCERAGVIHASPRLGGRGRSVGTERLFVSKVAQLSGCGQFTAV
jgi:hypothetical protein